MDTIISLVLGVSLLIIFYIYGIYPFMLKKYMYIPFTQEIPQEFPKISVVIPTHNEKTTIYNKLDNTVSLDYPADKIEVIIVDDSTDNTLEIIEKYLTETHEKNIKLVHIKSRKGKAHALNVALKHALGIIFIVTDANTTIKENSLKEIIKTFVMDKNIGCVSGMRTVPTPKNIIEHGEKNYWMFDSLIRLGQSNHSNVTGLIGELSAYRTDVLKEINGFDENFVAEDVWSALVIIQKGYKAKLCPFAVAEEPPPSTLSDIYERKARSSMGVLQTMIFCKHMLFNRKYGGFGTWVLPSYRVLYALSPFVGIALILSLAYILFKQIFILILPVVAVLLLTYMSIKSVEGKYKEVFDKSYAPEDNKIKIAIASIIYLLISQIAIMGGIYRLLFKKQKVFWKKLESTR